MARKAAETTGGSRQKATTPSPRAKPVRVTVDLDPADYDALRDWAHFARMSHADVMRALVRILVSDRSVDQQVRSSVSPKP